MKFANYAIVALGALLPQLCAGQGSLRVSSDLARMEDNQEVSLDTIFKGLDRRHLQALKRQNQASKKALMQEQVNTLDAEVKKLKEASDSNEIEPGDKADAVAQSLDALKTSIATIKDCAGSNGCSGKQIADTVFSVLGAVGFVVGVGFPPAGAVIAVVAALGSFIASFFGDDPVRAMPGLDAAAVEAAAFRAVMRAQATGTFSQFADFEKVLKDATKFNSNILIKLEELKKQGTDAKTIDTIVDEWYEQYHTYKWDSLMSYLKSVGTAYYSTYGDISGGRRDSFSKWITSSLKSCKLEKYLQTGQEGRDAMNKCKKDMADAKTNYDYLKQFSGFYVKSSTMLSAYWAGTVSIMTKHSTCGNNLADITCNYNIAFKALKYETTKAMFSHAEAMQKTTAKLSTTCEAPKPNTAVWPFNQKCETWPGKCNYEYLLLTSQSDMKAVSNKCEGDGCKLLINEVWSPDTMIKKCKDVVDKNKDKTGKSKSFYGGVMGWDSGQAKKPTDVGCSKAVGIANGAHDISMFAIPSYSVHIPECAALFKEAKNFGVAPDDPVGASGGSTGSTPAPTPSPTSCPEDTYSLVGYNGSDGVCWEEKVKACTLDSATSQITPNAIKAAKKQDYSSGWSSSSGGYWNKGVQKKRCLDRGFDNGDYQKSFWDLNNGKLYD